MALQEGQTLGPYQITAQLGQGGMATVYKAYHSKLDRYVAIKVMHPAFKDDGNFLARFEREAQIVAKLEHPHIVPVYDYSETDGQPYLVMKFIEGRTLKRILSGGPPTLEQILNILTPIAGALTYAHKQGVLHRDIKPSNIVMDNNGVPYLTDFGLARIAQAGESTMSADMILGTPQYISPEQARGERNLDSRTDLYSLGVILYEMVVGRVPFNADTPYAIVHDHIYSDLPKPSLLNPDIPPAVEAMLIKALSKNPADRYNTANEMIDAFRRAVAESGLTALDPERNKAAEEAFDRIDNAPTMPPVRTPTPVAIPAPIPTRRPTPSLNPDDRKVEMKMDFGDWDWGSKVEKGARYIEQWAEKIGEVANKNKTPLTEEERIRQRIEKKFKKRQELVTNAIAFVLVNIMLWVIWALTWTDFPWPIFPTIGWGIGVVTQYLEYRSKYGEGADRMERMVQEEIERERARLGEDIYLEKPKRDRRMRLTEDGELEEIPEDEYSRQEKQKRDR
jgi:serine/threonine protein kinase